LPSPSIIQNIALVGKCVQLWSTVLEKEEFKNGRTIKTIRKENKSLLVERGVRELGQFNEQNEDLKGI